MASKTQAGVSVVLGVGAAVLAGIALNSAVASNASQYPAVVSAAVTALDFRSPGYVQEITVKPGQSVKRGQVLAIQNPMVANAQLDASEASLAADQDTVTADTAAVAADKTKISQLQGPQLPQADQSRNAILIAKAQQQVADQQQAAADAKAVANQQLANANAVLQAQQTQLDTDTTTLDQACAVNPLPKPGPLSGVDCTTAQSRVDRDQLAVTEQQGLINVLQASAVQSAAQSASSVSLAQFNLQLAQNAPAEQSAPADAATVAEAQASLARDQAQVARDEAAVSRDSQQITTARVALSELQLTAPTDGVVLVVNGGVGALATEAGIREYGQSSQPATQQSSLFSLLPPQPQASSSSQPNGYVPMIEVRTAGDWQVTVQVAETQIARFTTGRAAKVAIPSVNMSNITASVAQVMPLPLDANGTVRYDVVFQLTGDPPPTILPGMTADVRLS